MYMYTKNIFNVINITPSMASWKSLQYHTKGQNLGWENFGVRVP